MSAPALAKALVLPEIAEGMHAVVEFTITPAEMQQFAVISGDFNPLHVDDGFARQKKFDGAIVYGALLIAKISQLIGMQLPGRDSVWSTVNMQFKKPLYVGQPAKAEGVVTAVSHATGMVELALTIRVQEKTVAKGKAEVLLVQS